MIANKSTTRVTAIGVLGFNKEIAPKTAEKKPYGKNFVEKTDYGYKIIEKITDSNNKEVSTKTTAKMFITTDAGVKYYFTADAEVFKDESKNIFYVWNKETRVTTTHTMEKAQDPALIKICDFMAKTNIKLGAIEVVSFNPMDLLNVLFENRGELSGKRVRAEIEESYKPNKEYNRLYTATTVNKIREPFASDVDGVKYNVTAYGKRDAIKLPESIDYTPVFNGELYITTQQPDGTLNSKGKNNYVNKLAKTFGMFKFDSMMDESMTEEERATRMVMIAEFIHSEAILEKEGTNEIITMEDGLWYEFRLEGNYCSDAKPAAPVILNQMDKLRIAQGLVTEAELIKSRTVKTKDENFIKLVPSSVVKSIAAKKNEYDELESLVTPADFYSTDVVVATKKWNPMA